MRAFLVIAHKFSGEVNLKDLPGSGRIDVIARCINSSIFLSHSIRRDVYFFAYFPNLNVRIRIDSSKVQYLNPDERSTAGLIKKAMEKIREYEVESTPGIFVKRASFRDILEEINERGKMFYLKENGEDIRKVNLPGNSAFVLGDSMDLTDEEENLLEEYNPVKISVSPKSLLSSHVITIVHNEMDRRGL